MAAERGCDAVHSRERTRPGLRGGREIPVLRSRRPCVRTVDAAGPALHPASSPDLGRVSALTSREDPCPDDDSEGADMYIGIGTLIVIIILAIIIF